MDHRLIGARHSCSVLLRRTLRYPPVLILVGVQKRYCGWDGWTAGTYYRYSHHVLQGRAGAQPPAPTNPCMQRQVRATKLWSATTTFCEGASNYKSALDYLPVIYYREICPENDSTAKMRVGDGASCVRMRTLLAVLLYALATSVSSSRDLLPLHQPLTSRKGFFNVTYSG